MSKGLENTAIRARTSCARRSRSVARTPRTPLGAVAFRQRRPPWIPASSYPWTADFAKFETPTRRRLPSSACRLPSSSSRDAPRDATSSHTHTHTCVSCNTHDDDSIRCFFDDSICFSLDREYPSHCLPTHTKTHIDAPNRESRAQSRARSIDGVDRRHRSHRGFHRCTSSMKMSSSIDGG